MAIDYKYAFSAFSVIAAVALGTGANAQTPSELDEFEKARRAELASRDRKDLRDRKFEARARFFGYFDMSDYTQSSMESALTAEKRSRFLHADLLDDRKPVLSRSYRATAPYYLLAKLHADLNQSGDRELFDVSTDTPGYWYFTRALTRDKFRGENSSIDYLVNALVLGATGNLEDAEPLQNSIRSFYSNRKSQVPLSFYDNIEAAAKDRARKEVRFGGHHKYNLLKNRRRWVRTEAKILSTGKIVSVNEGHRYIKQREKAHAEEIRSTNKKNLQKYLKSHLDRLADQDSDARRTSDFLTEYLLGIRRYRDMQLVESSLVALADFHHRCFGNGQDFSDLRKRLEAYGIRDIPNTAEIREPYRLFDRVHMELADAGRWGAYYVRTHTGWYSYPVSLYFSRGCGD